MKRSLLITYGSLYIVLYCFTSASSFVIVDQLEHAVPPMTLAFYAFLVTTIFFSILCVRNRKDLIGKIKRDTGLVLKMNIATTYMWISTFYAVKFLSPSLFLSIFLGVAPIIVLLLTINSPHAKKERYYDIGFAFLLAATLLALIVDEIFYLQQFAHVAFYILLAISSGIAGGFTLIYARQLSLKKFSAMQVLAVRFYLIILTSFFFIIYTQRSLSVPQGLFIYVTVIAGISIALPLYLLQKGLEKIDALHVAFITPLIPVISYFLQLIEPDYRFIWDEFILIVVLTLVIIASAAVKGQFAKAHLQESE